MTNLASLTVTQFSAYAELHRRERLWPSDRRAFDRTGRQFARRTLQALVDIGVARWESSPGVLSHVVPTEPGPEEHQLSAQRFYAIGLPVCFTIDDATGVITIDVDLSEADDIDEDQDACNRYERDQIDADRARLSNAVAVIGNHYSFNVI